MHNVVGKMAIEKKTISRVHIGAFFYGVINNLDLYIINYYDRFAK